jgi:DNA-directed RNA polymerase III subunit RPC3
MCRSHSSCLFDTDRLQHIFLTLLSHGRLVAPQLAQKCHLPLRQIQHGLAVLVQNGLICHYTINEGRTFYEANPRNAYHLVRSGRVIDIVQKRYGKVGASIITQLLLVGHAPVGQLRMSSRLHENLSRADKTNIDSDGANGGRGLGIPVGHYNDTEIDDCLKTLSKHGIICRLRESYFRTDADNRQIAEDRVHSSPSVSTAKGTKLKEEIAEKIDAEIEKAVDTHINTLKSSSDMIAQKRKINELDEQEAPNPKRFKWANGVASYDAYSDHTLLMGDDVNHFTDSLVVRLNYAKIAIIFRNNRLSALASNVYGKNVSRTYEAVLMLLEPDLFDPKEDTSLGPENERAHETSAEVNEHRLAQELAGPGMNGDRTAAQFPSVNGHVNGVTHRLAPEARSHLDILCQHPYRFLSHSLEHPDKYVVEYADLSLHLRNAEIFRIISSRFDKYSVRIVRVLLDKGKVDERDLQEIVLMSAKELRQTLSMLQQAGFVELQEVPREAQRQPSRTMYLWFYDPDRVRRMLIENTYKCMARCMQRTKVERDKVKPTIEKSERSDVKGKEEKLLPKAEFEVLKAWRRKEEWLLGEVGRLDELIFLLRDS